MEEVLLSHTAHDGVSIRGGSMYIEATPAKKRKGIYKYVVKKDIIFKGTSIKKSFRGENEFLGITESGDIIVRGSYKDGYAWDGCTPKFNIFDLCLIGIPDGRSIVNTEKPITYYASMVHDILYQYRDIIGITRKEADEVFLYYLGDFQLRHLYYGAVRLYSIYQKVKEQALKYANK